MDLQICAKRDFSCLGWAMLAMAALGIGAQFLMKVFINVLAVRLPGFLDSHMPMILMTLIPIYCVAMPVGWLLMRWIPVDPVMTTKMPGKHFAQMMLMSLPILYGGNLIGTVLSMLLSGGTAENGLVNMVNETPVFTGILAVVIAPVAEEFIFRKQIIDRVGRYGEVTGILVSALAFGLYHMNLFQFFYAFGLGILLAYVYTRTRMLRYSVMLHMLINFMGSVLAPMVLRAMDPELLEAISMGTAQMDQILAGLPGLMLYMGYSTLLMVGSAAGLAMLVNRWKKRVFFLTPAQLPDGTALRTVLVNPGMILFILACLGMMVYALV